jgi:hypothetical protein
MFRWWFVAIVVGAMLSQFAPAAFAGCEGGDSTAGHNAIAFCCDQGGRDKGDRHGKGGRSVVISGLHAR